MIKSIIKTSSIIFLIVIGSAINASAFDSITLNGEWLKNDNDFHFEMDDINTLSLHDMNTGFMIASYDPADNDKEILYATNLFHSSNIASGIAPAETYSDKRFGFDRLHKYLGYGTVVLAAAAAFSSSNKSIHYGTAYAAAGTALATCVTGVIEYSDRLSFEDGIFTEDNMHIILGLVGAIGLASAVAIEGNDQSIHSSIGVAGTGSIVVSLITIKW